MRVANKRQMYDMLDKGMFGNTCNRWFSLKAWMEETGYYKLTDVLDDPRLWAIRAAGVAGGDKRTAFDLSTLRLVYQYREWYGESGGEISPMVDHMLTARMHIVDGPYGLCVWLVEGKPHIKWRKAFTENSIHLYLSAARLSLKKYLCPNSLDDLDIVLSSYPGHVVELTTLDQCYGTIPHRNTVIWEVRDY